MCIVPLDPPYQRVLAVCPCGHGGERETKMCSTATTEFDGETDGVTNAVVRAIATAADREPTGLEFCLADYVDADAMERLFETANGTVELTAVVDEYDVRVSSAGTVTATAHCETPATCAASVIES